MKNVTRKDDKWTVLNGVFSRGVCSSFRVGISTFRVVGFVISSFRMALFRLFVFSHGVISSFREASFRVFRVVLFWGRKGTNQPPYLPTYEKPDYQQSCNRHLRPTPELIYCPSFLPYKCIREQI